MSATQQTEVLAQYIMENISGEPSQDEGAGDTAIRLLRRYRLALRSIVLLQAYPAPVATACEIAREALDFATGKVLHDST